MRKSPIHNYHEENGAFFGVAGGWERPMFYIPGLTNELSVPAEYDWYGYYDHPKRTETCMYEDVHENEYANWSYSKRVSGCIRQEVEHCRNECAIFDLTSFGKVGSQKRHHKRFHHFPVKILFRYKNIGLTHFIAQQFFF